MNLAPLTAAISRFTGSIAKLFDGKVDKVDGKQLSTEDYTSPEKVKLSSVKTMAMRDLHVSTEQPDDSVGEDGDIWVTIQPPQQ